MEGEEVEGLGMRRERREVNPTMQRAGSAWWNLQPGRSSLSSKGTLMYKASMKEARWGAACSDTFLEVAHESRQVLTLEVQKRLGIHVIYHIFLALASWFSTGVSNCFGKGLLP